MVYMGLTAQYDLNQELSIYLYNTYNPIVSHPSETRIIYLSLPCQPFHCGSATCLFFHCSHTFVSSTITGWKCRTAKCFQDGVSSAALRYTASTALVSAVTATAKHAMIQRLPDAGRLQQRKASGAMRPLITFRSAARTGSGMLELYSRRGLRTAPQSEGIPCAGRDGFGGHWGSSQLAEVLC